MDSDYNLTTLAPMMNVDGNGQILMPLPNGNEQHLQQQLPPQSQHHHELQPPANLNAQTTADIVHHHQHQQQLHYDNVAAVNANINSNATAALPQMPTDYGVVPEQHHHSLGSFFGESPHLEVLSGQYVQPSEMLQVIPTATTTQHQLQSNPAVLESHQEITNNEVVNDKAIEPEAVEEKTQEAQEDKAIEDKIAEDKAVEEKVVEDKIMEDKPVEEKSPDDEVVDGDATAEDAAQEDVEGEEEEDVEDDGEDEEAEEVEAIIPDDGLPPLISNSEEPEKFGDDDGAGNNDNDIPKPEDGVHEINSDSEQAASSSHTSRRRHEEDVDENQCRVCCAKEDLVNLFKKIEEQTVADMLMIICPSVHIAIKDFLPQFICNTCLDNVVKAVQLKQQCETTEKELRKKLSRHKNKIRRPAGYVVIDAPLDSDPASEDEHTNDEEFKVSDIASASPSEDSVSSASSDSKKKKRGRKRRKSGPNTNSSSKAKSKSAKSGNGSSDEDDGDPIGNHKRKRSSNSSPETFACDECDHVFMRKQSLILHRKSHSSEREPIACKVCGRKFKLRTAYKTHLEKHREDKALNKCQKCSRSFSSSADLKRHMSDDHPSGLVECPKCKKPFVSYNRLQSHRKQGRCPGYEKTKNKKTEVTTFVVGQDLFKTVAPLTTTYWSDSYSD